MTKGISTLQNESENQYDTLFHQHLPRRERDTGKSGGKTPGGLPKSVSGEWKR